MGILMMLILVGFMATLLLVSTKIGFGSTKKSIAVLHIALIIICLMTTGLSFGYSIHASNQVVGDAEQVGLIKPMRNADSGNVYYDKDANQYFIVQSDIWNFINPMHRTYLDIDIAKEYSDSYSKLIDSLKEG